MQTGSKAKHRTQRIHRLLAGLRLLAARSGNTAVEFAIILPVFLSVFVGIMEFGRMMWTKNALNYAVEEAARCAAINATLCGTQALVQSYSVSHSGYTFASADFTLSTPSCGTQVSATHAFDFIIPLWNLSVSLEATYCYPK